MLCANNRPRSFNRVEHLHHSDTYNALLIFIICPLRHTRSNTLHHCTIFITSTPCHIARNSLLYPNFISALPHVQSAFQYRSHSACAIDNSMHFGFPSYALHTTTLPTSNVINKTLAHAFPPQHLRTAFTTDVTLPFPIKHLHSSPHIHTFSSYFHSTNFKCDRYYFLSFTAILIPSLQYVLIKHHITFVMQQTQKT